MPPLRHQMKGTAAMYRSTETIVSTILVILFVLSLLR